MQMKDQIKLNLTLYCFKNVTEWLLKLLVTFMQLRGPLLFIYFSFLFSILGRTVD